MALALVGLGTAVPDFRLDQERALNVAQAVCPDQNQARLLRVLYRQSEIVARNLVFKQELIDDIVNGTRKTASSWLPDSHGSLGPPTSQRMQHYKGHAGPLALKAARQALAESGLAPGEITHLITVSCTGFQAPGVDVALIKALALRSDTQRMHLGFMGCHGALNGLRVARALVDSDPAARVLLCAVELCSLHYHYGSDPQRLVANLLFADGAAAIVGVPNAQAPRDAWRVSANGSCLFPDSQDAMTWDIGDHGFDMTLSAQVPGLIEAHLRPWLEQWLAANDLTLGGVGSWSIHPGGPRIVRTVARALDLDAEATAASQTVLQEHGNMSSPTSLFILDRLRRQDAPRPCVALGFGPGLAAEAALLR